MASQPSQSLPYPINPGQPVVGAGGFYPGLADFMGLELSEDMIRANMPEYLPENQVALRQSVSRRIFLFTNNYTDLILDPKLPQIMSVLIIHFHYYSILRST